MGKVKINEVPWARGFYIVSSPRGKHRVVGKENAISIAQATRRVIRKEAKRRSAF